MRELTDRVGLGWRPELAAGVLSNLDRIDLVEVILDDHLGKSRKELSSLVTLAAQVPVTYHGVGLGLASAHPVEERRVARLGRFFEAVRPASWSEHLCFVRAGGHEIGHLAAPPRNDATIEGALRNLERIRSVTGDGPALENIATLVEPPGSKYSEAEWVGRILAAADAPLLLDLHNLYANALNAGRDPSAVLREFPLERVAQVHLSGGHWIPEPGGAGRRLLDDHVHDPPPAVYALLSELAARVSQPFDVIVERDGDYPSIGELLAQLDLARAALRAGRARRRERGGADVRAQL